jgi:hypothetical protein
VPKCFTPPLFAKDHADGKVIGAAFEYQWGFKIVATKAIPKVMLEMKENSCDSAKM